MCLGWETITKPNLFDFTQEDENRRLTLYIYLHIELLRVYSDGH